MFMRLLHMKIDAARMPELREYYDQHVIPTLRSTVGCVFAGLIQSNEHHNECLSMTLWTTQTEAEQYGKGESFRHMLKDAHAFLAESSEWKVQLSAELTLETVPVIEEPTVKSYSLTSTTDEGMRDTAPAQSLYVRVVIPSVREGLGEEFRRIYAEEVIPALTGVKGCRYAFLSEAAGGKQELLSITIWDSAADAAEYEESELFHNISLSLKHTFSELFQWKMGLERTKSHNVVTSEDSSVEHYQVISGARFGSH